MLGTTPVYLSTLENAKRNIRTDYIGHIADTLEINVKELFVEKNEVINTRRPRKKEIIKIIEHFLHKCNFCSMTWYYISKLFSSNKKSNIDNIKIPSSEYHGLKLPFTIIIFLKLSSICNKGLSS